MSKRVRFWLQLLVSGGLLGLMLSYLDYDEAAQILGQAQPGYLFLMFVIYVTDRVLMAWKWNMLLRVLDQRLSLYEAIKLYYISSFMGYLLPLGGVGPDVVRVYKLKEQGIRVTTATVSIVVERLLGLVATLLIAIVGGLLLLKILATGTLDRVVTGLIIVTVVGTGLALLFVFHDGLRAQLLHLSRIKHLLEREKFKEFAASLAAYKACKRVLLIFLALSVFENLFPVFDIYVAGMALDIPLTFVQCLAVVPIATVLERLPISLFGLGLREGSYVVLFGLLGVGYSEALMIGIVTFFTFLLSLAPGLYWMITEGINPRRLP